MNSRMIQREDGEEDTDHEIEDYNTAWARGPVLH